MNKRSLEILTRIRQITLAAVSLLTVLLLLSGSVAVRAAGGDLDPTFNPGNGTEGGTQPGVEAIALQPDGKIIIGGIFTTYNNVPRNGIARLNPDGSLDTTFQVRMDNFAEVTSIVLQPDGKVIIGGLFKVPYISTTQNSSHIARLNSDGSFDTTFDVRAFYELFVSSLNAIALQPDGKIIVGGSFGTDFDDPLHRPRPGIMRLNQDGSIDRSFNVVKETQPRSALALTLQPNGKIVVAGVFELSSYPGPDKGIARFNADGSLDTSFDPGIGVNYNPYEDRYDQIVSMALQPDGKLIVGGLFRSFNGIPRYSITRLNPNGSLDSTFDPKGAGARDPYVFATALQPDGKIIIGGSFSNYDGIRRVGLARLNSNGSLDTTFDPGEQTDSNVRAIAVQPDGKILIGGLFQFYSGISRRGIARLLASGLGTFSFAATDYNVLESRQSAIVTVNRSGDLSQAATVDYATSDQAGLTPCNVITGMASARCDYAATVGTLRFAAGESQKNILIPIVNDSYVEAPEVFQVTLSNPVGAELGISVANVTIIDDDRFMASANPIRDDAFFIRQLYIDFLGREPDAAGLQGWLDILHNTKGQCKLPTDCDRVAVALGFFRSPEFQDRGYFVFRFYATALGRNPSYNEFVTDTATVSGFLNSQNLSDSKEAFVRQFMSRQEFKNRYDATLNDPMGYVDKLLQTVGLPAHPNRNAWIAGLTNGTLTRQQVLRQLVETTEVYARFYNQAFIVMQYFGFLRRDPDAAYQNWINIFNHSGDYRIITNGFINSPEYPSRFGP